jgi:branched-chain amino acid transport system permease protein
MVKSKETKFISPIKTDKSKYILPIIVIALAAVLPMVIKDQYIIRVLNMAMLYSIIALSVNLIVGISGQLDFGRSAFVGLGAYWSALTMMKLNFPFIVALLK